MPYRRLPNTDQARIRALKAVVKLGEKNDIYDLAVTLKTLTEVRNFLAHFEAAQTFYLECYERQAESGKKHLPHVKMARLYVSHFIQVLNLAVIRSEIRASQKTLYGLKAEDTSVPDLSSEQELVKWGRRIIEGERKRTSQGGIPVYTPTIAKVKVHYDIFMDSYNNQKNLQKATARSLEALASMRGTGDKLILDVWNQVEAKYADIPLLEERLNLCRSYGVIYYYRTGEKEKMNADTTNGSLINSNEID
jgi:hypothetical protein